MRLTIKKNVEINPKFFNKDHTVTGYAFACGYAERYETSERVPYTLTITTPPIETTSAAVEARIWREGNAYHVSVGDYRDGFAKLDAHKVFERVKDARKYVHEVSRMLGEETK